MAQSMVWVLLALLAMAAAGIFFAVSGRAQATKKKQEKDQREKSLRREKQQAGRRARKLSENGPVGPVSSAGRAASLAPKTPQLNALHEKLAMASASSDARLGQAAGAAFYSALFEEETLSEAQGPAEGASPIAAEPTAKAKQEAAEERSAAPHADNRKELAESGELLASPFAAVGEPRHADWAFGETLATPLALHDAQRAHAGHSAPVAREGQESEAGQAGQAGQAGAASGAEPAEPSRPEASPEKAHSDVAAESAQNALEQTEASHGAGPALAEPEPAESLPSVSPEAQEARGEEARQLDSAALARDAAGEAPVDSAAGSPEAALAPAEPVQESPEAAMADPLARSVAQDAPQAEKIQGKSAEAALDAEEGSRHEALPESAAHAAAQPEQAQTGDQFSAAAPMGHADARDDSALAGGWDEEFLAALDLGGFSAQAPAVPADVGAAAKAQGGAQSAAEDSEQAPRTLKEMQDARRQERGASQSLPDELQDGSESLRGLAQRSQAGGDWWKASSDQGALPPGWNDEEEEEAAPWRVLVVDDSGVARAKVSKSLRQIGCEVTEAKDGQEAWEKMGAWKPDLLVTDVEMPRLDGIALSHRVKSDLRLASIPIIIMSAHLTNLWERIADAQVEGVLPKPFDDAHLHDQAKVLLAGKNA